MRRDDLIAALRAEVEAVQRPHPVRVAIDGPDAAGKTTLADELARAMAGRGREVIRASVDSFHHPRAHRYRQGSDSPSGCYEDTFDHAAIRELLLEPLGPGGSRRYRRASFDFRTDTAVREPAATADPDAILLFDGVFLQRPELADLWDLRIFVSVGFDVVIRRARGRDVDLEVIGAADEIERRYLSRYVPAQRIYFAVARPRESAEVVVVNDDPAHPGLVRRAMHG